MGEYEEIIESGDPEGGWVDTHHNANLNEQVLEMTLSSGDSSKTNKTNANVVNKSVDDEDEDEDDGEAEDMESYLASGQIDENDEVFKD